MDKAAFTSYCQVQLKQVFASTKNRKPDNKLKHRTEGLLLAGEMLGVINRTEASDLVEQAHIEIFGESSSKRAERRESLDQLKALSPDEYFDIPAIERQR